MKYQKHALFLLETVVDLPDIAPKFFRKSALSNLKGFESTVDYLFKAL